MAERGRAAGSRPAAHTPKTRDPSLTNPHFGPVSEVEAKPCLEQTNRANGERSRGAASMATSSADGQVDDSTTLDTCEGRVVVARRAGLNGRPPTLTNRGAANSILNVESAAVCAISGAFKE